MPRKIHIGGEIHIGIYGSDDPHQMTETINAYLLRGGSLLNTDIPCDYAEFGSQVMRKIFQHGSKRLERVVVHPGNYKGIGPADPISDTSVLNAIVLGMRKFDPLKDYSVSDGVIDLEAED